MTTKILHVALFSGGVNNRGVNNSPRVELIANGHKFYMSLYSEIFRNLLVTKHLNYGYQFQSFLGALFFKINQFPSIVMFGMKGFYVSASGAMQGHHGPLVLNIIIAIDACHWHVASSQVFVKLSQNL